MDHCTNCGAQAAGGDYCPLCGRPLTPAAAEPTGEATVEQTAEAPWQAIDRTVVGDPALWESSGGLYRGAADQDATQLRTPSAPVPPPIASASGPDVAPHAGRYPTPTPYSGQHQTLASQYPAQTPAQYPAPYPSPYPAQSAAQPQGQYQLGQQPPPYPDGAYSGPVAQYVQLAYAPDGVYGGGRRKSPVLPILAGVVVALAALIGGVLLLPGLFAGSTPGGTKITAGVPATTLGGGSVAPASTTTTTVAPVAPVGQTVFVTVVESIPKAEHSLNEARGMFEKYPGGRQRMLLDSTNTQGLTPNYWVIADGPYPDAAAAGSACATYGKAVGTTCYAKPVVLSAASSQAGPYVRETATQQCADKAIPDQATCQLAYDFLIRYSDSEKNLTASEIATYWAPAGNYYGEQLTRAQILARVTKPTSGGTVYMGGQLTSVTSTPDGGATVRVSVPYVKPAQGLNYTTVRYDLLPGDAANPYRISSVRDES